MLDCSPWTAFWRDASAKSEMIAPDRGVIARVASAIHSITTTNRDIVPQIKWFCSPHHDGHRAVLKEYSIQSKKYRKLPVFR
jgi:hypothetical protein